MTALDHTQDLSGVEQHRLTSLYDPPDFVKQASHDRLFGDPEELPKHAYADASAGLFPCHSAPATWMSALFFYNKRNEIPAVKAASIEERIEAAADYFNIGQAVRDLKVKIAADSKDDSTQLPDTDFALVWIDEDGSKERHYPLRNPEEVKTAADWFARFRDDFTFPDRQCIASRIIEKAAQYNVSLDDSEMLHQTAGFGYCAKSELVDMLEQRGNLVKRSHSQHAAEMLKLAAIVKQTDYDMRDHGLRLKVAEIVDLFDRDTRLRQMYDDGGLDRPEEVLFQITEKVANDFVNKHVQLTSGTVYEKAAFDNLDRSLVEQWMGSEFADAVYVGNYVDTEKLAIVANTLPRPDAEMFDRMTDVAGIPVFAKTAEATNTGLSREDLFELAELYDHEKALAGFQP